MSTRAGAAALLAAAALAGCGGGGDSSSGGGAPSTSGPPVREQKTRVRVVEGLGKRGGLDAERLYRSLAPGVVTIISEYPGGGLPRSPEALGSGFVLDGQGYIATNAHVIRADPPKLQRAKAVYVEFADGNRVQAAIVGDDIFSDVALLKIDPRGLTLTPLRLGSTSGVAVGDPVAAIGSPFGEEQSLSVGVVSALHRTIDSLTNFSIGDAVQTDAAINHGNSGGPLLAANGRVIGINSQIRSTGGGGEGVGFAISVEIAKRSLAQLRRPPHKIAYAYLGVTTQSLWPQLAQHLRLPVSRGALVVKVEPDGPAKAAGVSGGSHKITFQGQPGVPTDGDVIVGIAGRRVRSSDDVGQAILRHRPGESVRFELLRGGKRRTVTVKLGARPANPSTQ